MKQTRIIRISFLLCAAFAIVAFWTGFYFGENSTQPEQILTASGRPASETEAGTAQEPASVSGTTVSRKEASADDASETSADSTDDAAGTERYYIRDAGDYLAVYHGGTDELYFETDLKLSDLPQDLREEARRGISFSSLGELYGFLENYSS